MIDRKQMWYKPNTDITYKIDFNRCNLQHTCKKFDRSKMDVRCKTDVAHMKHSRQTCDESKTNVSQFQDITHKMDLTGVSWNTYVR